MTDTPAPNDISKIENIGCCDIDPQRCAGMCSYADLRAPVAAGGEELTDAVSMLGVLLNDGTGRVYSDRDYAHDVLLKHAGLFTRLCKAALKQPTAPAVDLEELKQENPYHTRADKIKNQRQYDFISGWNDCIDHLAAQGMIKGVE